MNKYVLAFLKCSGIGNVKLLNYLSKYKFNINEILNNKHEVLKDKDVFMFDDYVLMSQNEIENNQKKGILNISVFDKNYPIKLLCIKDPILFLYYKGNVDLLNNTAIAVIGSREIGPNDKRIAAEVSNAIAKKNITVVSGLAVGTDTYAHKGSYKEIGHTIAVLPSGLDDIFPLTNKELANQILINNGLLISEYSVGIIPTKYSFVKRDRIQAALADAVIVIKASETSGTMHAVQTAYESKKFVSCYRKNKNKLIKNTFENVEDVEEIILIAKQKKYELVQKEIYEQESLF